jgi:signal transduction histidine kinase
MDTVSLVYRDRGMSWRGKNRSVVSVSIAVFYLVAGLAVVSVESGLIAWMAIPAALAAYAVGVSHSWRVTLSTTVSAGALYAAGLSFIRPSHNTWAGMGPIVLFAMVAGAAVGLVVQARRELNRERVEQARQDERLSIAQDVHDMVAHHIAVVNVQAGAASHLLKDQPDKAGEALGHVTAASGKALDELGSLLGVLRDPTTGLDSVESLLADDVSLTIAGSRRPLPATVDVTAYRIVQESLTNARKHGSGQIRLTLTYQPARLIIETRNVRSGKPAEGSGYGLTGMRERVALLGGELTAGPSGDEFVVRAAMEVR